jgi:Flp pilus assembly protein TadB
MVKFLYILAAVFVAIWAIGFFFYSLGAFIHLILMLAIIALLIRYFYRSSRKKNAREIRRET